MRYIAAFLIVMLSLLEQVSAQDTDSLVVKNTANKSEIIQMHPDSESKPVFLQELHQGADLRTPVLPIMNFNPLKGWKIEQGSLFDIRSISNFPFGNNLTVLFRQSAWDFYQGLYGIRTYQVNNKFYFGTAGYSDKSFNEYSLKSGIYRQTNYSSSLFVGYKFSEKFSISAGITIQHNNDPLNRFQPIQNGGIFP
jgi:hypothetical protein